ncbi:nucleotidyltransferase domain-containing protein [Pseudomonas sp. F1_0610]|uniref:nucleotidyltransferase domain-containing protein n=1 Tax=Pseudomonas sp. F1_0610 TaxID=3114284 RepID=UPI0039C41E55
MPNSSVHNEIQKRLRTIEDEHDVKILLAVESGSRAWGFESKNSDYDARFIYVHPQDWYLSINIESQRDVIEYPIVDDIDINGWDLRKALQLLQKSNPGFVEWIQSPIVYEYKGSFHQKAKELLPKVYSLERGHYHYYHMAKSNFKQCLTKDYIPLKKYLYTLRALLSARWLELYQQPAPIEFARLCSILPNQISLKESLKQLVLQKKTNLELDLSPFIEPIHSFITQELLRAESVIINDIYSIKETEPLLSDLFRSVLTEVWS